MGLLRVLQIETEAPTEQGSAMTRTRHSRDARGTHKLAFMLRHEKTYPALLFITELRCHFYRASTKIEILETLPSRGSRHDGITITEAEPLSQARARGVEVQCTRLSVDAVKRRGSRTERSKSETRRSQPDVRDAIIVDNEVVGVPVFNTTGELRGGIWTDERAIVDAISRIVTRARVSMTESKTAKQ